MALSAAVAENAAPNPGVVASRQAPTVSDMRALLSTLGPKSSAESLRLLRDAYPDAPLSLRVAACVRPDA